MFSVSLMGSEVELIGIFLPSANFLNSVGSDKKHSQLIEIVGGSGKD